MPILSPNSELTFEQRQKFKVLIKEAESRGLPIADVLRAKFIQKTRKWETDKNGYFSRRDGKFFKPYESQKNFVHSLSRFSLFIGGRGSGKSCGGAQKALQKIKQGFSGAVLNPKFENFKDSTWPEFRDWIPWKYVTKQHRYRANAGWEPQRPFRIAFENGATVICKGLHDPGSARGPNINWLWFDEAQDDPDGMAWKIAIASVRVGESPQAWATATGRGTYHWMYEFFVEQNFPPDVIDAFKQLGLDLNGETSLIDWFEGTIFDNRDNLDPFFFASMLVAYPAGYLREQEIYGKFADPGGNLGNPAWFNEKILEDAPTDTKSRIRYWDLAASEKKIAGKKLTDPDETVGSLVSHSIVDGKDRFCIENQISGTWEWEEIKRRIVEMAMQDGPFVAVYLEEEPGSGGINQVAQIKLDLKKELPGWTVKSHNPRGEGDKIMRANIWFAEATLGKWYIVRGAWNDSFLKQLSSFPSGKHDDKIDSISGARICIAPINQWKKIPFMHINQAFEPKPDTDAGGDKTILTL